MQQYDQPTWFRYPKTRVDIARSIKNCVDECRRDKEMAQVV